MDKNISYIYCKKNDYKQNDRRNVKNCEISRIYIVLFKIKCYSFAAIF